MKYLKHNLTQLLAEYNYIPLVIMRVMFGLFYFTSGFNKVFVEANQQALLETLTQVGIPFASFMSPVVACCEMVFGLCLAIGFFTRVSALALFIISFMALLLVEINAIPSGVNLITWYSYLFYLPSVCYIVMSLVFIFSGSVRLSFDRFFNND